MKEEFVSHSQAQALKECGFDWECDHYYEGQKGFGLRESSIFSQTFDVSDYWHNFNAYDPNRHRQHGNPFYSAPTQALAQKWLRDEKGIDMDIRTSFIGRKKYDFVVINGTRQFFAKESYDSYESALAAGITQALELIKQK